MTRISDFIEMKIPAKPEYVGVVRLTVSGIANRLGYTYDDIEDIKISVAEACTNVVNHAYKESSKEPVILITCGIFADRMEVSVTDQGGAVDVNSLKNGECPVQPDMVIEELREGGLGLFLIETLMDKVEISGDSGVMIVMTKFLQRDGVGQDDNRISTELPKQ
ncbi:serine/threonine-protein kinase RsbW [Evansella caseinilytica]|uniref:Serine-protein kinase RsbW n=1 Tax=Evansella caseinilytica TaxID=1503961 RepID=A0A1H3QIZ2_9BACI|nr:anti-sigma B factor RsbW [Evansella caseinilytica]SDZ13317.1 serine/threonine-protein kinase RsbW [Evansella caseinilytica]